MLDFDFDPSPKPELFEDSWRLSIVSSSPRSPSPPPPLLMVEVVPSRAAVKKKVAKRHQYPTFCAICGGPSTGYHYGAASCNGCRTFFRRSILAQRTYVCYKKNDCLIDISDRSSCRACRFRKCLTEGMNALAIEDERMESNALAHRLAKRQHSDEPTTSDEEPEAKLQMLSSTMNVEDEMTQRVSFVTLLEAKVNFLRRSTFTDENHMGLSLHDVLPKHSVLGQSHKYKLITEWSQQEFLRRNAGQELKVARRRRKSKRIGWIFLDLLVAVEYAKAFSFFSCLSDSDKSVLIRGTGLNCMILTQAFDTVLHKSDSLRFPDGYMLVNRLKKFASSPLRETCRKRYLSIELAEAICNRSVEPLLRLRLDEKEYALLKAVVLCHAACDGLSDEGRRLVEAERNAFAGVLLEYCRRSRGAVEGATHFANAVAVLDTLVHASQKHRYFHVLLKMNHQHKCYSKHNCHPLVDELMD